MCISQNKTKWQLFNAHYKPCTKIIFPSREWSVQNIWRFDWLTWPIKKQKRKISTSWHEKYYDFFNNLARGILWDIWLNRMILSEPSKLSIKGKSKKCCCSYFKIYWIHFKNNYFVHLNQWSQNQASSAYHIYHSKWSKWVCLSVCFFFV
jgi:hypothetical protein